MRVGTLDFSEHTSEEERAAIAAFPYAMQTKKDEDPEEDDFDAFLDKIAAATQASATPDLFTYWVMRTVAETIFREYLTSPNPQTDDAELLADKQMYGIAYASTADVFETSPLAPGVLAKMLENHEKLADLLKKQQRLVTTTQGSAHFYPQTISYSARSGDELAVLEFLHAALHMPQYLTASIIHVCSMSSEYMNLGYRALWIWLVGEQNKNAPVSMWPDNSGLPFVNYMRALHVIYEKAQSITV